MTDDLLATLRKVSAHLAATPHDPARATAGRCNCLPCRTDRLAARGWPTSVVGDGSGVRGTTPTSSTERAATVRDPFGIINQRLAMHLSQIWGNALAVLAIAAVVDSHASDDDPVRPGQGACGCGCGHMCKPDRNPEDRLRSGLAPTCYRRWLRWRSAYPGHSITEYIAACYRERGESYAHPVAPPAGELAS